jgi:predicted homoserine dehydrogenase-like protein
MDLSSMLKERAAAGRPIRIGQIGAGKFGTIFLAQDGSAGDPLGMDP